MNANKYEQREKRFIRLLKRLDKVEAEIKARPELPLKEPYQRGWEVYYKLRDDVSRRADAEELTEKIKLAFDGKRITTSVKEVKRIRKGERGYFKMGWDGKKYYHSFGPKRKYLSEREYRGLDEPTKLWFSDNAPPGWRSDDKKYTLYIPEHLLVLKVRPNMITHYYEKGGDLESEKKELEDALEPYWRGRSGWRGKYPSGYLSGRKRMETRMKINCYLNGEADDILIERVKKSYW